MRQWKLPKFGGKLAPRSLILSVINTKKTKAPHSQTAKRWQQQAREEQYVTFQETWHDINDFSTKTMEIRRMEWQNAGS